MGLSKSRWKGEAVCRKCKCQVSAFRACDYKRPYRYTCIFHFILWIGIFQFLFSPPTHLCWVKYHFTHSSNWGQIISTDKDIDIFSTNMLIKLLIYLNLLLCCSYRCPWYLPWVSSYYIPWPCFFVHYSVSDCPMLCWCWSAMLACLPGPGDLSFQLLSHTQMNTGLQKCEYCRRMWYFIFSLHLGYFRGTPEVHWPWISVSPRYSAA